MLWIQAADGTLINLAQCQEVFERNGILYVIGLSGRHKLAASADGANLTNVVAAIKAALGSTAYSDLSGVIPLGS